MAATDDFARVLGEAVDGAIGTARAGERVLAAIGQVGPLVEALERLVDLDPELAPEVAVAAEHAREIMGALTRAAGFVDARHAVMLERFANAGVNGGGSDGGE